MSIDRGMDREDVVHTYNGMLVCHKIEWNNAICSNVDRHRDYYTKIKSEREQLIPHGSTYMWNLKKNNINELIDQTE